MTRIAWAGLMRVGMISLGLKPDEFWALTPGELALMLGEGSGVAPVGRARLAELERLYGGAGKECGDE
jgi:uncharacterized phage protein (TIGR02216 family)